MASDYNESARIVRDNRQHLAMEWAKKAFSIEEATSLHQRGLRLLEEAIELFQACVASANRAEVNMQNGRRKAHELVDFVFGREIGDIGQELGGVSVCMLVLAEAAGLSVDFAEFEELNRVLSKPIEEFTKRNAAKNAAGFLAVVPKTVSITPAPVLITSHGAPLEQRLDAGVSGHFATRYSKDGAVTSIECMCGAVFKGQNTDEAYAKHVTFGAGMFDAKPRVREWMCPTDEEVSLFAAVWAVEAARELAIQTGMTHVTSGRQENAIAYAAACRALEMQAQQWCATHPGDHRVPTEIAAGITDKNPTRIHTIKPDGSIPTLAVPAPAKAPRVMHLRRLPSSSVDPAPGPDECLMCHKLAENFEREDMYTYESDVYKLEARRCAGLGQDGSYGFVECSSCANKPGAPTLCPSCVHNLAAIAWWEKLWRGAVDNLTSLRDEIDGLRKHAEETDHYKRMVSHFSNLSTARFTELEEIRKLIVHPYLSDASEERHALEFVKELATAYDRSQVVIKDYEQFAGADAMKIQTLQRELDYARNTLRRVEQNNELGKLVAAVDAPVPMFLTCPMCNTRHIDEGEFATKPHHTHACQHCGLTWRPAVGPTVGVQYLPGFKNEVK